MVTKETDVNKYCCLYTSNFHLEMILLPTIRNNIDKTEIYIFTEEDLIDSVKILLERTNFKDSEKEKILKLNWKSKNIFSNNYENCTIIINGSNNYISKINRELESKNIRKTTIIDCYSLYENKENVKKIEQKYKCILNTKHL